MTPNASFIDKRLGLTECGGYEGYEEIIDPMTGNVTGQVERATGELYENRNVNVPAGTIFYTPEQQRQRAINAKQAQARRQRGRSNSSLGRFYYVPIHTEFEGLTPETVTRLIYLATYLPFGENRLMRTERTPIMRKDLPTVLGLSKATVSRFLHEVSPVYFKEDTSGQMLLNSGIFKRGRMMRRQYTQYQKFYLDGVRRLYEGVEAKHHRRLALYQRRVQCAVSPGVHSGNGACRGGVAYHSRVL